MADTDVRRPSQVAALTTTRCRVLSLCAVAVRLPALAACGDSPVPPDASADGLHSRGDGARSGGTVTSHGSPWTATSSVITTRSRSARW